MSTWTLFLQTEDGGFTARVYAKNLKGAWAEAARRFSCRCAYISNSACWKV